MKKEYFIFFFVKGSKMMKMKVINENEKWRFRLELDYFLIESLIFFNW